MSNKIRIGQMFAAPAGQSNGRESLVLEGMELLLSDGREIDPREYRRLSQLTRAQGFGNRLPAVQGSVEGIDQYIVARKAKKQGVEKDGR